MVGISQYSWHEWQTGTSTEILMGLHLNACMDYVSAIINSGITGANLAANAVSAGVFVASGIIEERHLNKTLASSIRVLQIGKNTTTVTGQMLVKGTSSIASSNTNNQNVTVYFNAGDCCTTGDPGFVNVPIVYATVYTSATPTILVSTCATGSCVINVKLNGTETFTVPWVLYWNAIGNK